MLRFVKNCCSNAIFIFKFASQQKIKVCCSIKKDFFIINTFILLLNYSLSFVYKTFLKKLVYKTLRILKGGGNKRFSGA